MSPPTKGPLGEIIEIWTEHQLPLKGNLQPKKGKLDSEPEGLLSKATYVLYCNLKTQRGKDAVPTDILQGDRIVLPAGPAPHEFRVIFVSDEGGQGDHLKVYLATVGTAGD